MNKKKSTEDKYVTYLHKWSCIVKEWHQIFNPVANVYKTLNPKPHLFIWPHVKVVTWV